MDATSPIPALASFIVAYISVFFLAKVFCIGPQDGRVSTIDGLRGYLGFGVYVHHAMIWFFYLQSGTWAVPPSNLYTHLGQTSVVTFFMVTGFLFYSKILSHHSVDWTRLFISRLLRLVPLYLFVIVALFLVVCILSDWALRVPGDELLGDLLAWILFLQSDINGLDNTSIILAKVTWTLPYEWAFYLGLPLIALFSGRHPPMATLVLGIIGVLYIYRLGLNLRIFAPFLGGMLAATLAKLPHFRRLAAHWLSSLFIIVCVGLVMTLCKTAYSVLALVALTAAFSLIAAGNSIFGVLTTRVSRSLGEITYSIYLLHGLMLFVLFRFGIGFDAAAALSASQFWAVIILMTPVLILISMVTFTLVEAPAIQSTNAVTARIKGTWAAWVVRRSNL